MSEGAVIIDGKAISQKIKEDIKTRISDFEKKFGKRPGLAVVLVGNDEASHIYVNMKEKACKSTGIISTKYILPQETQEEEILDLVKRLNHDDAVHGILVQLPLPKQIDSNRVLNEISTKKDVDGFHPASVGRLVTGEKSLLPCTPAGIIVLIKSTGVTIEGKKAVVVGRSNIVGKPVAALLLRENATVTVCHSKTVDLDKTVNDSDIIVAAIGKPEFIKGRWIKEGAVVIDVGVNRIGDKRLVGDVEFIEAKKRASHITPVPGGVGPMTIAMLLSNTLEAAYMIEGESK